MNLRIWGCEDARIQASAHEPEDTRMQDASKGVWTWGYEHVGMRGYKQVHTKIRIEMRGCGDVRIQASAQEPKNMNMQW